jgi:hypothetical protein
LDCEHECVARVIESHISEITPEMVTVNDGILFSSAPIPTEYIHAMRAEDKTFMKRFMGSLLGYF